MKAMSLKRRIYTFYNTAPYPNAATRRQILHKLLDTLIMGAAGAGLGALLLLMLALR